MIYVTRDITVCIFRGMGMGDLSRAVQNNYRVSTEDFLNESPTDMEMEIETVSTQKEYGQKKEAEGDVWMLLTFALKKSMKLLHCSSVASTGEDDHIFFLFHLYECSYSSHAGKHTHG